VTISSISQTFGDAYRNSFASSFLTCVTLPPKEYLLLFSFGKPRLVSSFIMSYKRYKIPFPLPKCFTKVQGSWLFRLQLFPSVLQWYPWAIYREHKFHSQVEAIPLIPCMIGCDLSGYIGDVKVPVPCALNCPPTGIHYILQLVAKQNWRNEWNKSNDLRPHNLTKPFSCSGNLFSWFGIIITRSIKRKFSGF